MAARLDVEASLRSMKRLPASAHFKDGKIGRRIAAGESRGHNTAIGQRCLNFFIAAKNVFRRNNDTSRQRHR